MEACHNCDENAAKMQTTHPADRRQKLDTEGDQELPRNSGPLNISFSSPTFFLT